MKGARNFEDFSFVDEIKSIKLLIEKECCDKAYGIISIWMNLVVLDRSNTHISLVFVLKIYDTHRESMLIVL